MPAKQRARRVRGEGAIYQRSRDGLWVGTIEAGWSEDGKRKRITVTARRQPDLIVKLAEKRRTFADHGNVPGAMTTKAWLEYWLDNVARTAVRPRTLDAYRSLVTTHLIPVLGRQRLDKLAPQHVRALHTHLETATVRRGGKDVPLSSGMALKVHRVLAKALEDARLDGKVTRNVAKLVKAPRSRPVEREPLTVAEAKKVLTTSAQAQDPMASRWAAALILGTRQGEALGLTWDRVDLDEATADITWQLQRLKFRHGCKATPKGWACGKTRAGACPDRRLDVPPGFELRQLDGGLCLTRPKSTAGERRTPIPSLMAEVLRIHRDAAPANPHGLVWANDDGSPIDPKHDLAAWYAALDRAGVPRVPLHAARHTTGTLLLFLGADVKVIGQILGHTRALTTRGYQHVDDTMARAAMEGLGDLLAIEA